MKVAIVHDWFVGGGAEKVVLELHKLYPEAPIYTSYCSPAWRKKLEATEIHTSFMQYWPLSKLRKFLPIFRIFWFSRLDLSMYDLVISSSGAEAKGIKVKKPAIHINYCHAPTHYYWSRYDEYIENPGFGRLDWLARFGLKLLVGPLRKWDFKAAQRPDYIIANSTYTQKMIQKYYGRDSTVIHPPVDIDRFDQTIDEPRRGYVIAGRQTPYKKIDLAVKAFSELGFPLLVLGNGPQHRYLQKIANRNISFIRRASDEQLAHYFQTSLGFIFPGIDDFGIVAVEALAAGTPVIAYKDGGALDYVKSGVTGVLFNEQTSESLVAAIKAFNPESYSATKIKTFAQDYSPQQFNKTINQYVQKVTSQ